jgi:TetR/AcrR family transcriptional regulator, regulator of cefoperazone and chloramphenicol sensitivity
VEERALAVGTADRLLDAAIDQFGRYGLDGASTRRIAAAAGATMSQITYHYGGKDGLYLAAARHIAREIGARTGVGLAVEPAPEEATDPAEALLSLLDRFAQVLLSPESATWALFVVREQMNPTAAFEELYARAVERALDRVAALLVAVSAGRCSASEARLKTIALIGQVLAFRVARAAVLRATGWRDVGPEEAILVRNVVRAHTSAILADLRGGKNA